MARLEIRAGPGRHVRQLDDGAEEGAARRARGVGGRGAEPKQKGAGQVCYSRLQTTTTRGRDGARLVGVASLYSDRAALVVPCGLVAEVE